MTQWKHKMPSNKMIMCLLRMMNFGYMILLISFKIPLKTMLNFANFWWTIIVMFWLLDFKIRIKMYLLLFCDESFYFIFYFFHFICMWITLHWKILLNVVIFYFKCIKIWKKMIIFFIKFKLFLFNYVHKNVLFDMLF